MRFDDSLKTVLSADMATGFGAQSAWRQLVDLMGRRRIDSDEPTIARLRMLRQAVPVPVRAASARALAFATPDAALVGFFAEDELAIVAPVLRTATLPREDWIALLPRLTPAGRSVLRHRRDLPGDVTRGLESFGATDFVLDYAPTADVAVPALPEPALPEPALHEPEVPEPAVAEPIATVVTWAPEPVPAVGPPEPPLAAAPPPGTPQGMSSFVALGDIARSLPVVAEALRHAQTAPAPDPARFEISDLVARIDAFNRQRVVDPLPMPTAFSEKDAFRYETDATGTIRWVDGVARASLIGVSFAYAAVQGGAQIDGIAAGAYRRRSAFADARLLVEGLSDAAGSWRISGVPVFDPASGRFTGYRGSARRPRRDETAEPKGILRSAASDSLRQLVHELRTPANAVAGFAELIETQLLGPVPDTYRERATTIRSQAADLIAAIDDLDTAARIEGHALDLRIDVVPMVPLLMRVAADLEPLARLRGTVVAIDPDSIACDVAADDRATERLVGRLMSALVSAGTAGERIDIGVAQAADGVVLSIGRPRALGHLADAALLSIDAEREVERDGAPLLGTGFALRLAQNLAIELGGALTFGPDRLTLRLPAVVDRSVGQASIN